MVNSIDFNNNYNIKIQNRGTKQSGITFELKNIFDEMAKQNLIKDKDGKGVTKEEAQNLYAVLNKMHQETNRATNYTSMSDGTEFSYTAEEMTTLAQAAGYEIVEQEVKPKEQNEPEIIQPEIVPLEEEHVDEHPPVIYQGDDGSNSTPVQAEIKPLEHVTNHPPVEYKGDDVQKPKEHEMTKTERKAAKREEKAQRKALKAQAKAEQKSVKKADVDFRAGNQTGKIVNGKYYINGNEVPKEVYEVAKTRAAAQSQEVEAAKQVKGQAKQAVQEEHAKPFTPEQIANIKVSVNNLEYEFTEKGLTKQGVVGYSYGPNQLMDLANKGGFGGAIKEVTDKKTGKHSYKIFDKTYDNFNLANNYKTFYTNNLSIDHAIYTDLKNKGGERTEAEKRFMSNFEQRIADFYRDCGAEI